MDEQDTRIVARLRKTLGVPEDVSDAEVHKAARGHFLFAVSRIQVAWLALINALSASTPEAEDAQLAEIVRLRESMHRIVAVLGPKVPPCCEGCEWEWAEALRVAREALQPPNAALNGGGPTEQQETAAGSPPSV